MDAFQAVSGYVTKMVSTGDGATGANATKMKILLLDNDTVSCAITTAGQRLTFIAGLGRIISNNAIRSPEPPGLPDGSPG